MTLRIVLLCMQKLRNVNIILNKVKQYKQEKNQLSLKEPFISLLCHVL